MKTRRFFAKIVLRKNLRYAIINTGMKYYTYILRCADGSLYTGFTTDIDKRISVHNAGKGAKYTRSRLPVALFYLEEWESEHEARSREWQIKRLTHGQKINLAEEKHEETKL